MPTSRKDLHREQCEIQERDRPVVGPHVAHFRSHPVQVSLLAFVAISAVP